LRTAADRFFHPISFTRPAATGTRPSISAKKVLIWFYQSDSFSGSPKKKVNMQRIKSVSVRVADRQTV
jgi:hypothetical protein